MPIGLPVAIALLAQTASAAAPAPAPATTTAPAAPDDGCKDKANADTREIVICAQKPQGYRLNPDVMQAKRAIRGGGRPTRPGPGGYHDNSRCVVGPEGCPSYGINLIGAALTAGEIASRLAKGQEIGSLFITDPHPSEYQLYQEFKREREAKEAAKAAAKAKAVAAPVQGTTPPAAAPPPVPAPGP